MRIAALDDDALQLQLLEQVVTEAGHSCHSFLKGTALQQALRRESFDLLLVDWELPDVPGTQVVHWVREQVSKELPIIFITHRSEEADIVEGLNCGADDFMIKPIRAAELRARMSALLRRAYPLSAQSVLNFGPYRFITATNSIEMDGQPVEITHREYTLALTLFQNQGRLLSRDHLREVVWGHNSEVQSRSLDTHVSRLRNLLNLRAGQSYSISAIYGYGYRLDVPEAETASTPSDS
ncbi:MAG: response regulator transcription factor [Comamonas sp.]|jgi:DNA-binding response OmpR family regulator|uniref:response regulator transcription factor n=1 Tax=Comamonas sp. TaxID=34028 RepID=UPI00283427F8|nr:response regulator transcription factor [Comamonas sp.]MDR0216290.1 response regulator transcription factor [Comamonas sp.]